jgi:hypothetical protein
MLTLLGREPSARLPVSSRHPGGDQRSERRRHLLAAGVHDVAATINVSKGVTIEGLGSATVRGTTSAARNVFKITASNVALRGLDITLSSTYSLAPTELEDCLIGVPASAGLSGVVISGNTLHWPTQPGAMSTWGGRAVTVGGSGAPGIVITANTVYNTRTASSSSNNPPSSPTTGLQHQGRRDELHQQPMPTRARSAATPGERCTTRDVV